MRFPPLRRALLLVLAAASSALAQDGKVTLQFVSFPKTLKPEPVELLIGKGKTMMVELPTHELSAPYRVDAREAWALGKMDEDAEGKPAFTVYGRTKSLGVAKQLILVIRKGKTSADGFKLIPFDNRAGKFGGGQFLFVNAATVAIAGEVGTRKFALAPGRTAIITPRPDQGDQLCHATLFYRINQEAKGFLDTNWPLQPDARGLIFIYNDPRTSRLRLHTIRDFP